MSVARFLWGTIALFGITGASPAHANIVCSFNPSPFSTGEGVSEGCNVTGSSMNGHSEFSIPQFNPALGQLEDFIFGFHVDLSGTAMLSIPAVCREFSEEPPFDCIQWQVTNFAITGSASFGGPVDVGPRGPGIDPSVFGSFLCDTPPSCTVPVPFDFAFDWGLTGIFGADLAPVIGTGQLTFDVDGSVGQSLSCCAGSFPFAMSYSGDFRYDFIATVPEPSLLVTTGLLLGFVMREYHRRTRPIG